MAEQATAQHNFPAALELAVLNRLAPQDRQVVYELCQQHLAEMLG